METLKLLLDHSTERKELQIAAELCGPQDSSPPHCLPDPFVCALHPDVQIFCRCSLVVPSLGRDGIGEGSSWTRILPDLWMNAPNAGGSSSSVPHANPVRTSGQQEHDTQGLKRNRNGRYWQKPGDNDEENNPRNIRRRRKLWPFPLADHVNDPNETEDDWK